MGDIVFDLRAWSFVKPVYVLSLMNDALNCLRLSQDQTLKG
jgi:hypothetical protein